MTAWLPPGSSDSTCFHYCFTMKLCWDERVFFVIRYFGDSTRSWPKGNTSLLLTGWLVTASTWGPWMTSMTKTTRSSWLLEQRSVKMSVAPSAMLMCTPLIFVLYCSGERNLTRGGRLVRNCPTCRKGECETLACAWPSLLVPRMSLRAVGKTGDGSIGQYA